jgi:glycerol-3-phosphate dehydrogenase
MTSEPKVTTFDFAIIGAGVVGTAIARELSHYDLKVLLVDSNLDVGESTSKANTAILHTGFDMKPGTLESKLVKRGYQLLHAYAADNNIAVEETGALLVAWNEIELSELAIIQAKAIENGYSRTEILTAEKLYDLEPNLGIGALAALSVPDEFIIDPWSVSTAFATQAKLAGTTIELGFKVMSINTAKDSWELVGSKKTFRTKFLINAAGLYSDAIDSMLGFSDLKITPRKGELIVFDKFARRLVSHIILPVPTKMGKGVLISPTIFGNVMLGPTAEDLEDKTDTSTTENGIVSLLEKGRKIVPSLIGEEVTATYAGLRAASNQSDYFITMRTDLSFITVGGIRSTGLTSSMAIAEYVREQIVVSGYHLGERSELLPLIMPNLGERNLRPYKSAEAIARNPEYGKIVCHCEKATLGEINDAFNSEIPPVSLNGLARRTRAGLGRCQGFYCAAELERLLAGKSNSTNE